MGLLLGLIFLGFAMLFFTAACDCEDDGATYVGLATAGLSVLVACLCLAV